VSNVSIALFQPLIFKANKVSKVKGQGKLNRRIIVGSVLVLFAKNFQN